MSKRDARRWEYEQMRETPPPLPSWAIAAIVAGVVLLIALKPLGVL